MEYFAGLDVSMEETHVCVIDRDGKVILEVRTPTVPKATCRNGWRNMQIGYPAGYQIGQEQTAGAWAHDLHFDMCHRGAERVRMNHQRLTHTAIVAATSGRRQRRYRSSTAVGIDRQRPVAFTGLRACA
jgi:hypothetical protein